MQQVKHGEEKGGENILKNELHGQGDDAFNTKHARVEEKGREKSLIILHTHTSPSLSSSSYILRIAEKLV